MPTKFEDTVNAIKGGLKSLTVAAATKNIETWEKYLETHEHAGTKKIAKDLHSLRQHLGHDPVDGAAIKTLIQKLGKETVAVADEVSGANGSKIKQIGEALTHAAATADHGDTGHAKGH